MSTTLIDDSPIVLDAESEVRKLQELVKKLQLQNQLLLKHQENSGGSADLTNSAVDLENQITRNVDANCNNSSEAGVIQYNGLPAAKLNGGGSCVGVLREQQLNSTNARVCTRLEEDVCLDFGRGARANTYSDAQARSNDVGKPLLETVGLIDVDGISLDEEDSWLYQSPEPKMLSKQADSSVLSPYDWLREDFERPSPELISARRTLAIKLDEVSHFSPMAVSKKLVEKFETTKKTAAAMIDRGDVVEIMGIQPAVGRTSAKQASFAKPSSGTAHNRSPQSSPRASPQPVDVEEGVSSRYNKMTVKHKTKDQKEVPALQDICQKQERDLQAIMGSLDESSRRKMNETFKRTSASEENLLSAGSGGGYRLNDVMDVKQLAKMQEESLRLSFNSPLLSRKGLSKSLNRSSGALVVEDVVGGAQESQTPLGVSNGLHRSSGSLLQRTRSSAGDSKRRDQPSSPTSKLDDGARHASRSTGSLLSPQADKFVQQATGFHQPVLDGYASPKAGSPAAGSEVKMPPDGAGRSSLARMPRSGLHQRSGLSGLKTPKSGVRSSSLHGPRIGGAEQAVAGRKTSLTFAPNEIGTSLPGSPCVSTQDLHQQPALAAADGHRQSMPNLSRGTPKLSLPLALRSSDQLLAGAATLHVASSESAAAATVPAKNASVVQKTTSNPSLRQPTKMTPSAASSRHPPSPTRDAKSRTMTASSASQSGTTGKGNATLRQPTRLVAPSKTRLPSPSSRRPLVSATAAATASNDDSWKDGCF